MFQTDGIQMAPIVFVKFVEFVANKTATNSTIHALCLLTV